MPGAASRPDPVNPFDPGPIPLHVYPMWTRSLLALSVLLAGTLSASAEPDCAHPTAPDAALVAELLGWIGANSPYANSPALSGTPDIAFCTEGEAISLDNEAYLVQPDTRAAYDPQEHRIFLALPWDAADRFDTSVLLHELVHHVQLQSRRWECINAAEWEAYTLQDKWLRHHGITHDFDWMLIFFMSRCPKNPHPD